MTYKIIAGISLALLAVGAIVGLMPISAAGANCGSAFVQEHGNLYIALVHSSYAADACKSLISVVRIPAIALLVLGAIGSLAAISMYTSATAPTAQAKAQRPKPTG